MKQHKQRYNGLACKMLRDSHNLYTHVHSSITYNIQKVETTPNVHQLVGG